MTRKTKENILLAGRIIGIIMFIAGFFLGEMLPADKNIVAIAVIVIGFFIHVLSYAATKRVYVCPECKAEFRMPEGEITMTTGNSVAAFLTCPECKRTNLCRGRQALKMKGAANE